MTQNIQKRIIFNIIKQEAIKRRDLLHLLSTAFSTDFPGITDRIMRKLIEEMVNKDGYNVQSSNEGYSAITNSNQVEDAKLYLKKKAFSLFKRATNIHKNFYGNNAQLSIEEFLQKT